MLAARLIFSIFVLFASTTAYATHGRVLHGIGPANQAMGGAGAAYPTDVASAAKWNPATLWDLDSGRVEVFAEYFILNRRVSNRFDANAFSPGVPAVDLQGSLQGDTNAALLPTLAGAYRRDGSDSTFAVALIALAGFGVEYGAEGSPGPGSNPLLSNQPPTGLGFGRVLYDHQLMKPIFVLAIGLEQEIGMRGVVRAGYNYVENPIPSSRSFYNVPASAIIEHHLSVGATPAVVSNWDLSLTYYHGFKNSDDGPVVMPSGALSGTRVRHELSGNSVLVGLAYRFSASHENG